MNRQILRLAIPNIISNITIPLVGMVDLAILGHLESELYIGAIALGGMIFNFIYAIFSFLRMGTSGFTAQAYGEGNPTECILMLGRSMLLGLSGGLVLIVLQTPIDLLSFYIIDGSAEVEAFAREYFHIRIFAAPASLGIMALSGWFIGMQNARIPMFIAIIINIVNIALNYLFVYEMGMKSDGVAWGTLIAQYSGLGMGFVFFVKHYKEELKHWDPKNFFNFKILKKFFKVNTDIIIRTVCLIFAFAFFTAKSAQIDDTLLAVNTVLLQYLFLFSYITDGFAHAAESLVGKYTGRKNLILLKKTIKYLFIWGLALSLPFTLTYVLAGKNLLYLLTDNPVVLESSGPYIFWIGLVPVISFAAFIWDGIYIGATASAAMRNALLISTILVFLPSYFLSVPYLGNHGLWLAMMLFMISRGVLLTVYSRKNIFNLQQA